MVDKFALLVMFSHLYIYNTIPMDGGDARSSFYSVKSVMAQTLVCLLCPEPVPHISRMPRIIVPDLNECDKEGGYLAASSRV